MFSHLQEEKFLTVLKEFDIRIFDVQQELTKIFLKE